MKKFAEALKSQDIGLDINMARLEAFVTLRVGTFR